MSLLSLNQATKPASPIDKAWNTSRSDENKQLYGHEREKVWMTEENKQRGC